MSDQQTTLRSELFGFWFNDRTGSDVLIPGMPVAWLLYCTVVHLNHGFKPCVVEVLSIRHARDHLGILGSCPETKVQI
jgi:hypothetical protein